MKYSDVLAHGTWQRRHMRMSSLGQEQTYGDLRVTEYRLKRPPHLSKVAFVEYPPNERAIINILQRKRSY